MPRFFRYAGDDDEQRDRRDRQEDVGQEVHDLVDDPAHVCGGDAEDRGDGGGEHTGCRAEQQRAPGAEHDLREDVAALVGRPEQVVPRRRLPGREDVEVVRVRDGDERRDQRDDHDERDHGEAGARLRVLQQERDPTGKVQPSPTHALGRRCEQVEGRVELRHQARPQPRVEDEVEHVHDQVRDDHADGEHDEERLRERVVVAEHGLLQREAGAGVAEDELDEDEAADRAREQRGEAVERRQDRVAARVARHHAPVAEALRVRHRHVVLADRVDHHRAHVQHPAAGVGR